MGEIKVGCCGFCVSQKKYFSTFKVLEVQQSFYKNLTDRQVQNWSQQAPKEFEFIMKIHQCITHPPNSPTYRRSELAPEKRRGCGFFRLSDTVEEVMKRFFETMKGLNADKVVVQTPASFKDTKENIENMHKFFKKFCGPVYFWEARGWDQNKASKLAEKLGVNLVMPVESIEEPETKLYPGDILYIRLHGTLKGYNKKYSEEELKKLAEAIEKDGRVAYVMFNNVYMYEDALNFMKIIGQL